MATPHTRILPNNYTLPAGLTFERKLGHRPGVFLVRDGSYLRVLKFQTHSSLARRASLDELQERARQSGNRLHVPVRSGRAGGLFFTVTEYLPHGSLLGLLSRPEVARGDAARALVRDLAKGCGQLHTGAAGEARFIHGDIKPSNVLVEQAGDWRFRLGDFDSSILLRGDPPVGGGVPATVAYAAPEVLRGGERVGPAADYWSLGMTLLTALVREHPFHGLNEEQIRRLVVTSEWRFDPGAITTEEMDDSFLSLVAGLLQRVPDSRWGAQEVAEWLAGDTGRVGSGLRLLRERVSEEPYQIGGELVRTAAGAAHALLRTWDTDTFVADAFLDWLRFNPNAAAQVEECRGMACVHHGLLRFCHSFYRGNIPPLWRGEAVNEGGLTRLADQAGAGDRGARDRLLGLCSMRSELVPYYDGSVSNLLSRIERARERYLAAWATLEAAGGPNHQPDDEDDILVHAVRIACTVLSAEDRRHRLARLFDPRLIWARCDWFFAFGTDPDGIGAAQMYVLGWVDIESLLRDVNPVRIGAGGRIDEGAIRNGIAFPQTHERLLHSFAVAPGASFETHTQGDGRAIGEWAIRCWRDLLGSARNLANRLRHRPSRDLPPPLPASLEARSLPLAIKLPGAMRLPEANTAGASRLVLVSWTDAGPNGKLVIGDQLGFPLLTFRVAGSGRAQVVVVGNARITLSGRRDGSRWVSGPIRIRVQPGPELLRVVPRFEESEALTRVTDGLRQADPLASIVATMRLPDTLAHPDLGWLSSPSTTLLAPETMAMIDRMQAADKPGRICSRNG